MLLPAKQYEKLKNLVQFLLVCGLLRWLLSLATQRQPDDQQPVPPCPLFDNVGCFFTARLHRGAIVLTHKPKTHTSSTNSLGWL